MFMGCRPIVGQCRKHALRKTLTFDLNRRFLTACGWGQKKNYKICFIPATLCIVMMSSMNRSTAVVLSPAFSRFRLAIFANTVALYKRNVYTVIQRPSKMYFLFVWPGTQIACTALVTTDQILFVHPFSDDSHNRFSLWKVRQRCPAHRNSFLIYIYIL